MKSIPDICIVGTDTGVGKTVVSLLLMKWLYAKGYTPFYLKPFQTGCADPYDADSDAAFVYRHTPALEDEDPGQSVIFCLPNPKAPYFAARDANERIDLEKLWPVIEDKRSVHSPLIVEAAGGLLVPVTDTHLIIDLIPRLNCRPLLVARAGLGTINHTLLSIEAMEQRQISPLGVVLVKSGASDEATLIAENMDAIESYSGIRVGGIVPIISGFAVPPANAYRVLERILL